MEISIEFVQLPKIRINACFPNGEIKGLLCIEGHKDGSCFFSCPNKYLTVSSYRYGLIVMPGGVTRKENYNMSEENGFVITNKIPKLSFHPDKYIHISLSTPEDSKHSRRIDMGKPIGDLNGKTIGYLQWENLNGFNNITLKKDDRFNVNFKYENNYNNAYATIKSSYSLEDFFNDIQYKIDDKTYSAKLEGLDFNILQSIKDGNFVILKELIVNQNKFCLYDSEKNKSYVPKNPVYGFLYGIKDNTKIGQGRIVWYLMSFFNPLDVPYNNKDRNPSILFKAGLKNWESNKIRETGEMVVIYGKKDCIDYKL